MPVAEKELRFFCAARQYRSFFGRNRDERLVNAFGFERVALSPTAWCATERKTRNLIRQIRRKRRFRKSVVRIGQFNHFK